jgi:hypothetical protein
MKSLPLAVLALALAAAAARADSRVVMISIDGLRPEVYLDPEPLGLQMPNLVALPARCCFSTSARPPQSRPRLRR